METKPSLEQQQSFQAAYEHLDRALFGGVLPPCYLTFTRAHQVIGGYFSPNRWSDDNGNVAHEIALNAEAVARHDLLTVYGWLIHEMVHLWQFEFGKPSRGGYHNREFADRCKAIGLQPQDLDTGREVGQRVNTSLIPGSLAEEAIASLPDMAIFPWAASSIFEGGQQEGEGEGKQEQKGKGKGGKATRRKFTCGTCGLNAWAKPGAKLICGDCQVSMA
jgi:hypothetical protein